MLAGVLACGLAGTVLTGCGSEGLPAVGDPPTTPSSAASTAPTPSSTAAPGDADEGQGSSSPTPDPAGTTESAEGTDPTTDATTAPTAGAEDRALEMPAEPDDEDDERPLSELVAARERPLVRAPLPRAASTQDELVTGFPTVLRPVRSTRVETSSVSPSDGRLQVALVADTSLTPAQVLVAYRTRLAGRGLVERPSPATTPGSLAAAFRRGRDVVTVTVTTATNGSSYVVQASLHAGGE